MTIKEAQELIEVWNEKNGIRNSELTGVALLTEKVGDLARVVAEKHSDVSKNNLRLSEEIAQVFWELLSISAQSHTDLTDALISILEQKNK